MDRDRLGVQMIPRFTMGPAMPSALTVFVAAFRRPISDPDHVERDIRVAAKEIFTTLQADKRVLHSEENSGN